MTPTRNIGAIIPSVLLPREGIDLHKWAVIACDQFTSEPEYWAEAADIVGDAPSTLNLILPEVYLETPEEARRVASIREAMAGYLDRGVFVEHRGLILVERTVEGRTRHGIMLALDLDAYDYTRGAASLIRATEGTILERIPPRVRIRAGAALELPHILVLIDDPQRTVIEPLVAARKELRVLYDFDLMLGSGHLTGYLADDGGRQLAALAGLADPATFECKYALQAGAPVMVFAMGDGNHSLATAKAIWEQLKPQLTPEQAATHPARYALVEVENIHDEGLHFEPIHRVLFDVKADLAAGLDAYCPGRWRMAACAGMDEMVRLVDGQPAGAHAIGVIAADGCRVLYIAEPPSNLPVGTLQAFLDAWGKTPDMSGGGYAKIDYVHGLDVTARLGSQPGNLGFYLPGISTGDFFKTVIVDGALPRKTFSMGEAREKRFYMEARRITV
jgi:hypothetical protein